MGRFGSAEKASYWEAVLFGWHTKAFGRKRVSFQLLESDESGYPAPWAKDLHLEDWSGINYLTAQGFKERGQVKQKSFTLVARVSQRPLGKDIFEKAPDSKDRWPLAQKTLVDAMALIGLIGGIGARSRRGFGSLAVTYLRIDEEEPCIAALPKSVEDYGRQIRAHLGEARFSGEPPYSALSDQFSCDICASNDDLRQLMNDIGWAFQIYRSYGQRGGEGHVHVKKSDGAGVRIEAGTDPRKDWYADAFYDDHDDFYAPDNGNGTFPSGAFDNRSVLGLPHNYGKTQVGWDSDALKKADGAQHRRRASPLLFHFHRLQDTTGVFASSVIPARFTPTDACLRVDGTLRTKTIWNNIDFELAKGFNTFLRRSAPVPKTAFTCQEWSCP